jgi:hypothetical protein
MYARPPEAEAGATNEDLERERSLVVQDRLGDDEHLSVRDLLLTDIRQRREHDLMTYLASRNLAVEPGDQRAVGRQRLIAPDGPVLRTGHLGRGSA